MNWRRDLEDYRIRQAARNKRNHDVIEAREALGIKLGRRETFDYYSGKVVYNSPRANEDIYWKEYYGQF